MQKWQYAVLWFVRRGESGPVEVELRTSGEPRKLGTAAASSLSEFSQSMMYWLDFLGDEGWEAYAVDGDRIFLKRPIE